MALSANGWPALSVPPRAIRVPGADVELTVRPGDVATILIEVARRYHEEVERLDVKAVDRGKVVRTDDWGWAFRPIRGQTNGLSNHASGTAVDLNATRHPRGVRGTYTREQRRNIRRILASTYDAGADCEVVRCGEWYSTTVDGQHFEINASPAAVNRVATRIRAKYAEPIKPKPAPKPIQEEDDDMKSDEEIDLGKWAAAVLRDVDGKVTVEEAMAIQTASAAQTNEFVHAMAKTLAAMQVTQQEMLVELRKLAGKRSG